MDKLVSLIDGINSIILSLPDYQLNEVITKFESHSEDDETWEEYSELAKNYVEPDQVDSDIQRLYDSDDSKVIEFIESIGTQKSLTDFYLKHGVLSNCSDAQIKFCRLIDKVGY